MSNGDALHELTGKLNLSERDESNLAVGNFDLCDVLLKIEYTVDLFSAGSPPTSLKAIEASFDGRGAASFIDVEFRHL